MRNKDNYTCHCLAAHLKPRLEDKAASVYTLDVKTVLARMVEEWPELEFATASRDSFRDFYKTVSNQIFHERLEEKGWQEADIGEALGKRTCMGCGMHVWFALQHKPELFQEAIQERHIAMLSSMAVSARNQAVQAFA